MTTTCVNKKKYLYNFVLFNNLIQCFPINDDVIKPMKVYSTMKNHNNSIKDQYKNQYKELTNTFISTTETNINSSIHNNTPNNENNDDVICDNEYKNLQYGVVYSAKL